jgi:hypothetical protein
VAVVVLFVEHELAFRVVPSVRLATKEFKVLELEAKGRNACWMVAADITNIDTTTTIFYIRICSWLSKFPSKEISGSSLPLDRSEPDSFGRT